ncbi:MAG: twin-arginine translocase subunit TatC [Desulfobacterota bacterium]|nr:twin-arginine translocase subunit TatC [Thermodesulfobacteriota bacterium]
MEDEKLPLTAHLEELRKRIIICLIAIGVGFFISYLFSEQIFALLSRPLVAVLPRNSSFIFTGITEAFFTYLKLSLFSGIFLASPVIIYQIWKFVAPGLYEQERRSILPFVITATFLFIIGIVFCYAIVLPAAFKFFVSYNTDTIRMLPSLGEYLTFTCVFLLAFGIVFEVPVFVVCLAKLGILKEHHLTSNRKLIILGSFIVAALLTPTPDAINQSLMAIPMIILYELSIIVVRYMKKMPRKNN